MSMGDIRSKLGGRNFSTPATVKDRFSAPVFGFEHAPRGTIERCDHSAARSPPVERLIVFSPGSVLDGRAKFLARWPAKRAVSDVDLVVDEW